MSSSPFPVPFPSLITHSKRRLITTMQVFAHIFSVLQNVIIIVGVVRISFYSFTVSWLTFPFGFSYMKSHLTLRNEVSPCMKSMCYVHRRAVRSAGEVSVNRNNKVPITVPLHQPIPPCSLMMWSQEQQIPSCQLKPVMRPIICHLPVRLYSNGSFILKDISVFLPSEKDMVLRVLGFLKGDLLTQD